MTVETPSAQGSSSWDVLIQVATLESPTQVSPSTLLMQKSMAELNKTKEEINTKIRSLKSSIGQFKRHGQEKSARYKQVSGKLERLDRKLKRVTTKIMELQGENNPHRHKRSDREPIYTTKAMTISTTPSTKRQKTASAVSGLEVHSVLQTRLNIVFTEEELYDEGEKYLLDARGAELSKDHKNYKFAYTFFDAAANKGYTIARYRMAEMAWFGEGVPLNPSDCLGHLQKASDQGFSIAFFAIQLYHLFLKTLSSGSSTSPLMSDSSPLTLFPIDLLVQLTPPVDISNWPAGALWQKAEENLQQAIVNRVHSQHLLFKNAFRCIEMASSKNDCPSQWLCGILTLLGYGVEKSRERASGILKSTLTYGETEASPLFLDLLRRLGVLPAGS